MKTLNEYIKEYRGPKTLLHEASLGRLVQHLDAGDAVAIVSACRGDRDPNPKKNEAKNKQLTNELRKRVLGMHFGYNKAVGGYTETLADGSKSDKVEETSTVIFASSDREKELFLLASELGEKFDQECILFIHANKEAEWVYTNPSKDSGIPKGARVKLGKFHPKQIGQYFTKIGKKSFSFVVEAEEIKSFSQTNGEIQLVNVSEAAKFEYLRRELKKRAAEA